LNPDMIIDLQHVQNPAGLPTETDDPWN